MRDFLDKAILPPQYLNMADSYRYFPESTQIRMQPMQAGVLGYVERNGPANNVARINEGWIRPDFMGSNLNTLLHEKAHANTHVTGDEKFQLAPEPTREVMRRLIERERRRDFAQRFDFASNALDSGEEAKANLVAKLGLAPRGTTLDDLIGTTVDEMLKERGPATIFKSRENKNKLSRLRETRDRNDVLRQIEMDMFPHERWIEPREPSMKERIHDYAIGIADKIDNLLSGRKKK